MERAITLFQPIASLVAKGTKTIETRSWPTKVRGALWIHAAAAFPPQSWLSRYVSNPVFRFYALGSHKWDERSAIREFEGKGIGEYPRAVIIGRVELIDCIPSKEVRARISPIDYRRENALGDLGPDRFAWILREPRLLKKPIVASGMQGFWDATSALDTTKIDWV